MTSGTARQPVVVGHFACPWFATTSTTPSATEATCLKTDIGNVHPRLGVGFRNKQGHILFSEAKDHS